MVQMRETNQNNNESYLSGSIFSISVVHGRRDTEEILVFGKVF